jgi:hypothetical protein
MRLAALSLACLILVACAPVVYPGAGDVLPVEAGRIVAAASATAGAVATQVAQATATDQSARATSTAARAGTLEAITDRQALATLSAGETQDVYSATAAAVTAQLQATSAAADTQAARSIQGTVTAAAATSTAALATTLAAEVVHREQLRTMIESATGGLWNVLQLLVAVAFMFGLFWLGGAINADLTRRRNNAALRETPLGPVIMLPGRDGPSSVRLLTAPEPAREEDDAEPEDAGEIIQYTVQGRPAAPIVAEWRQPELSAERAEIAALVRAAIKVEGEGGTRIPRYARLPGWQTNPDGWKARTDTLMLAGHVTKVSGRSGGTFLTQNRTLYQLLAGLLDGSLPLRIVDVVGADGQTLART